MPSGMDNNESTRMSSDVQDRESRQEQRQSWAGYTWGLAAKIGGGVMTGKVPPVTVTSLLCSHSNVVMY